MAIRPVTLRLLFGLWKAGEFGGVNKISRGELFAKGCRHLCEEAWDEQRDYPEGYDTDLRLRIAAHLALIMVFGNQQTLLFHEPERLLEDRELLLRDVIGETTLAGAKPGFVLGQPMVEQVLKHTGLFAPTPKQAFWAHQAYADFLAAYALYDARVPVPQLRNLFRSTVPEVGIVPALRDTAVWLASLSPDFAAALVEIDALTAIRADGLMATDAQRAQLVDDLFTLTREQHFYPYRAEPYFSRLRHAGLATQLTGPLTDPIVSPETRRLVNRLIEHCALREFAPLLLQQVLDETTPFGMRSSALRLLVHVGDAASYYQLRPLIETMPAEDSDDDFRGVLLQLLWPNHLSVCELTTLLTPLKQSNHIGAYHHFFEPELSGILKNTITAQHLPALLCWILRHAEKHTDFDTTVFDSVTRTALYLAWQHTDDSQVLKWLTPVLKQFWIRYSRALPSSIELRNTVLRYMAVHDKLPEPWMLINTYSSGNNTKAQALADLSNWPILLELTETANKFETKAILLKTAYYLLNKSFRVDTQQWQEGFSKIYTLVTSIAWPAASPQDDWVIQRDSENAESQRKDFSLNKEIRKEDRKRAHKIRKVNSRTFRLLIGLSNPNRTNVLASWNRVHRLLSRSATRKKISFLTNIRSQFSWVRSYKLLEQRLIALSQRVVSNSPPKADTLYEVNKLYHHNTIHLAALVTVGNEVPALLSTLSAEEWEPWVRLLLFVGNWAEEGSRQHLMAISMQQHRRAIIRQILTQHDYWQQVSKDEHGYSRLNNLLQEVPDELLRRVALHHVIAFSWGYHFTQEVFRQLLMLRFRPAELFCDALFAQTATGPALHRLTFAAVRITLFETEPTAAWWYYWQQAVLFGPALMRPLLESVGEWRQPLHAAGISLLTDTQLSEVLRWITIDLGVVEENDADDWQTDKPAGRVRSFRNSVAKLLASRATAEAWDILNTLSISLNHPRWVMYLLEEARETYSRLEWTPLPAADLLALCRKSSQRWVQGGEDLLEAVIESLDRLQGHMQGEPARANWLWYPANEPNGYRIRHGNKVVDENEVSDHVQDFLSTDLPKSISSYREVQVRAPSNPGTGQEIDLYVTATARNKRGELIETDKIIVFLEAKHNDNREVDSALDGQLVNRYLQNHAAKCGLFLVYWHTAETGRSISKGSIAGLRIELAQQAQAASKDGLLIRSYVLDIRLPDDL
jgi:hypothetical protein